MTKVDYVCIKCDQNKTKFKTNMRISSKEFKYIDSENHPVKGKVCYSCSLKIQRERRSTENNKTTRKYEKTKPGFLMRTYRNMLSRISGVQKKKMHLYKDKSILDKNSFYAWSMQDKKFNDLFYAWENSGYNRRLTPSIDRIDSSKGYSLDNIRWLEHWINSQNGAISRHHPNE